MKRVRVPMPRSQEEVSWIATRHMALQLLHFLHQQTSHVAHQTTSRRFHANAVSDNSCNKATERSRMD